MPTQPIRLYLPEVRERKYLHGAPGQYSERVSASIEAELRALAPGADWPADVVAVAREAVGGEPRTGDTITLYRGGFTDTRTWNSRKWVKIDQWIDGNTIVGGSIISPHIAANSIRGDRLVAGTIEAREVNANAIDAQLISANSIGAREVEADVAVMQNSVQIGDGLIEYYNLSDNLIRGLSGVERYGIPMFAYRDSNNSTGSGPSNAINWNWSGDVAQHSVLRLNANDIITASVNFSLNITIPEDYSIRSYNSGTMRVVAIAALFIGNNPSPTNTDPSPTKVIEWASRPLYANWNPSYIERRNRGDRYWSGPAYIINGDVGTRGPNTYRFSLAQTPINARRYLWTASTYWFFDTYTDFRLPEPQGTGSSTITLATTRG